MALKAWMIGAAAVTLAGECRSQTGTEIEFVTIGAPGNPGYPYASPPGYFNVQGRGRWITNTASASTR